MSFFTVQQKHNAATMFMEWSAAVISNDRWKDSIYEVLVKIMKLRFSQNLNLGLLNGISLISGGGT